MSTDVTLDGTGTITEFPAPAVDAKAAWLTPQTSPLTEVDMPVTVDGEERWITIRELTAGRLASINETIVSNNKQRVNVDQKRRSAMVFAAGVVGPDVFTELEAMQIQNLHGAAFTLVVDAIDDLSGVSDEALEKAKARFRSRPGR